MTDFAKTHHVGKTLVTTAYLNSINHWHGRPRGVYLAERKKWEAILRGTWALWGLAGDEKRILAVRRFVQAEKNLIKDRDNLVGAIKPVKDALVRVGVLKDDTDAHVTFSIEQFVDAKNARIEIEITK